MTWPKYEAWLVTGTRRGWPEKSLEAIAAVLEQGFGLPEILIVGDAPGIDTQFRNWAEYCGIPAPEFVANWAEHGNAAGPIRNQGMVDFSLPYKTLGLAFPDDRSRGTWDCVRRMELSLMDVQVFDLGFHR